jgi:[NiFe] hydrogenase diaphorase moiety small subunit
LTDVEHIAVSIDGKEFKLPKGINLVDALRLTGTQIPTLCWSKEIEPCLGTCRVCMVKINGRETAACTRTVDDGMVITCQTAELQDLRKGIVEMLFTEENHYCPGCEKSGDCELQAIAYEMEMTHSRYSYQFSHYDLDYRGKHLLLERNRCIHCKRCTELFVDDHDRKVFSFVGKGKETRVVMDLELERSLSPHKCQEAAQLCPVGAIIVKGKGFDRPIGTRKNDRLGTGDHQD